MSVLDKFRNGARRASAFVVDSSTKVASGSRDFMQGFTLPGEAEKAANILSSFLGKTGAFDGLSEISNSPELRHSSRPT
jgi:hypothetical protein